jgi:alpha-D-ribose 1-methylphosphonate 5-triphosphate diphosphatase
LEKAVIRIINATVLSALTFEKDYQVLIKENKIHAVLPMNMEVPEEFQSENVELINAKGAYVTPGFIDIHSDYIEHMAAPRPTSLMNFPLAIREMERELVAHGITTMFHSLSLFNSSDFDSKPIRNTENTQKFVDLIHKSHSQQHLIRHRFHCRLELNSIDRLDQVKQFITEEKVHLLSFMDHTPGQGQYRDLEMFKKTMKGYRNLSDSELDAMIEKQQERKKITLETIQALSKMARDNNIAVASHDDDTLEKIELNQQIGIDISEFPTSIDVAHAAQKAGYLTAAGAPNVLLGGSHSGNLSAAEAILDGAIDILCSDYYPSAILHAIFILHKKYGLDLASMFRLVTINPAKAVKMDHLIGSIEEGKLADILIIDHIEDDFPVISNAIIDGCHSFSTRYRRTETREQNSQSAKENASIELSPGGSK